jgi:hypothetical protein
MDFEEYINAYYGGTLGISKRYGIEKAQITESSMAEGLNTLYGAKVFNQLNTQSEVFKLLKKEPWTQSGWRVLTGRHDQTNGIAEGGALGTTDQPDLVEVRANLAEVVTVWEVTTKAELLSEADDGMGNLAAFMRKENAEAHAYYIDDQLLTTVDTPAFASTAGANKFESLDRVTSSYQYTVDLSFAASDGDMWDTGNDGIDRSAATAWADAVCASAGGTDRNMTLANMDYVIQEMMTAGVNYNDIILLTGYDTYQDIKQLMQNDGSASGWSYNLSQGGAGSMNGVTGEAGLAFDSRVGSYDGIPIFLSQHVEKDTTSRIHFLDMGNLAFRVAAPTTYLDSTNVAVTQTLSKDYAFLTAGNLICYKFQTQGSLRDLQ